MTALDMARGLPALPQRLLIGLSGGADSVALARLLLLIREEKALQLAAVHVNHGLRGEASDADASFVQAFCQAWNLPLYTYRAVLPPHASEENARQARYAFFHQAMQESRADALVLAHHRDDQAETLLLHLLRGAGMSGLCGMAADSVRDGIRIIRPLLGFSRLQLRSVLHDLGQSWREDASNTDPSYLRNAIRTQVIPQLEQLAPGCTGRIAATAGMLRQEEALLRQQTEAFLVANAGPRWVALQPLRALPEAMQARVLRAWWQQSHPEADERSLSSAQTAQLVALLQEKQGAACPLPMRESARLGWHCLHLEGKPEATEAPQPCAAENGARLGSYRFFVRPDRQTGTVIPASWLKDCTLRTACPGDWITPFGMTGTQNLNDYLAKRHIDVPFRHRIPLLCRGQEVLLAGGVGAGNGPKREDVSEELVEIGWEGNFPWTR